MTERKRWKEIDILRGMAIIMVLLYHSIIVFPLNLHEIQWCKTLHTFLWVVQMPLFFLVSGFCYSYRGDYKEYAWKKCLRILVPHIVFSMLDILPRIIPNPLVNEQMNPTEAILDFLLYGGSDWFLWTLFVIVMVFPAFEKLLKGSGRQQKLGVLLVAFLFLAKPYMTDFLLLDMVCQYLWYFLLGYGIKRKADILLPKVEQKRNLMVPMLGMLLFFAGFLAYAEEFQNGARYLELISVLWSFVLFYRLACMCKGKISGFLSLCGTWSLQMYLLDAYALVATRTVLITFMKITNPVLIIVGNFILDTGLVLLITCFILIKAKVFRIVCGIPEKG